MIGRPAARLFARALLVFLSGAAPSLAQTPECPAAKAKQQFSGIFTATGQTFRVPLALQPCHDVAIEVTTSDNSAMWGASFRMEILSRDGAALDTHDWSSLDKMTKQLPLDTFGSPYQGASDPDAHPDSALLRVTNMVASEVRWQVTLTTRPRRGYNIGAASFEEAPLVALGSELRGNLHPREMHGQTYRIRLGPGVSVSIDGTASRLQTTEGVAIVRLSLFDAERKPLRNESTVVSTATSPRTLPAIGFSNTTGAPATYYFRIAAEGRFISNFHLTVSDISENVFGDARPKPPKTAPVKKP